MSETLDGTATLPQEANIVEPIESQKKVRRYSPAAIWSEVRNVTWLKPHQVITGSLIVIVVSLIFITFIHYIDLGLSTAAIKLYAAESLASWGLWVLAPIQIASSLMTGYYAFKHPSPGDTLASIFGGQLVAQGSGVTPKARLLRRRMMTFTAIFILSTLALAIIL